MKVLSLFSGIGAFEKALRRLGVSYELVGFSEIDPAAIRSFCAIHGVSPSLNIGDVRKAAMTSLPDADLLVGGPPCQAFSLAGKRLGLEDERGRLIFAFVEVLKKKQPSAFLFENVKGLISFQKGAVFRLLMEEFSQAGYWVNFEVLNSKYFGSGQSRERLYIVGVRKDLVDERWVRAVDQIEGRKQKWIGKEGVVLDFPFPKQENVSVFVKDIMEPEVESRHWISQDLVEALIPQLEEAWRDTSLQEKDLKLAGLLNIKGMQITRRVYFAHGVSPTLTVVSGGNTQIKVAYREHERWVVRRLTAKEYWRLQTFDDEDVARATAAGVSERQLYKQAGNSITVSVLEHIFSALFDFLRQNGGVWHGIKGSHSSL
ncbi:DNA (cytosine-5-)-methyltransferase [Geobacillus subterraneus]|uniref:Cytosine-specific methyltransferase n=1 Tax=Geobacillus subterraneus TaxID=129338 RepID=A0A679FQN1_9BACL|nr:DNA (cytosine-5-)-methyltransferase [Geobacillus subterraneus]BBW98962.1 cytosine-specific methyltransferase [Geobacillus subterraneus]